jgi:anti-sigma factor RsiW
VSGVHPEFESWVERIQGSLSASDRESLEAHLAACSECRELERDVRRVLEALASDRLLEPSPAALRAVLRAIRPARESAPGPAWARGLPERMARLLFDTLATPELAFAGARIAAAARRLRFEANGLELDVLVETDGDRHRLTAQLLSSGPEIAPVAGSRFLIVVGGRVEAEGETDADGELACSVAGAGELEIRLAACGTLAVFRVPER